MTDKKCVLWNRDLATKAKNQHKYIFVHKNQKQRKMKVLTGAMKAWYPPNKQPILYVYLSDLRLMGLEEDVVDFLTKESFSEKEIKTHLATAYSIDHHGDQFNHELELIKEYQAQENKTQKDKIKYTLEDMIWFAEHLKDVKEEPIDKIHKALNSPKSKRDLCRDLYEKVKLTPSSWLNVSHLDTTGGKIRDTPTKKSVQSATLQLETDNLKNYRKAIEWLFGSTENYETDIEQVKNLLNKKKTPKKLGSPKKFKSPGAITTRGGENFVAIPPLKK